MSVSSVVEVFAPDKKPEDTNSPTGVSAWGECQRKWAFRYITKIYGPATPSTALGTDTHDQLEHYLRDARDLNYTRNSGEIAAALLHFAPKPQTPGMILEREFYFRSKRTGFVYTGKKDVELPPGIPQPQLQAPVSNLLPVWFDGSVPIVIDWKTTKSINDYAKTSADLEADPQSNIYALDSMARFSASAADLAWLYSQTSGAKRSQAARIRLGAGHVLKVFDGIEREAEGMARARELAKGQSDLLAVVRSLPPTVSACKNFGGCPYRTQCQLSTADKLRSRMGLIDDLRNRVSTTPESTTAPPAPAPEAPAETPDLSGDPTKVPAPTELPKWMTETQKDPINPPERDLPPAPLPEKDTTAGADKKEDAPPADQEKKTRKPRAPKAPPPDPKGADALAHTGGDVAASNGAEVASASGSVTQPSPYSDKSKAELEQTIAATVRAGFTLYVDCIPSGKVRTLDRFIAKAQERMAKDGPRDAQGNGVPDYRLVDFGKGAPAFVAFVIDQIDGQDDLFLDTRTPEGAVLLSALSAKASYVVRGIR